MTSGHLTLVARIDRRIDHRIAGLFRCECGNSIELPIGRVKTGKRSHCGCLANRRPRLRHGMRNSPEYKSWLAMKQRCLYPQAKSYPQYGGDGVTIAAEWVESFEAFYAYVGPRPPGTSLDRINPLGNYEPGNVRWATALEQAENRRNSSDVEVGGVTFASMSAAARHVGVTKQTIRRWCGLDSTRGAVPPRAGCRRSRRYVE